MIGCFSQESWAPVSAVRVFKTRIAVPFARSVVFEEKEKKKNSKGQCDTVMAGNEATLSNLQFLLRGCLQR